MNAIVRFAAVAGILAAVPVAAPWAQTQTPEAGSGTVAKPTYPSGQSNNPAVTGSGTAASNASRNPRVPGATGSTVVPGNNSSVATDRRGTVQQKAGSSTSSGGG